MTNNTYSINSKRRIISKGKPFCTALYDDFLLELEAYRSNNDGKYPTQRVLADICRISHRTARKVIDISKNKRTLHTVRRINKKGTVNYGSRSLEISEQMFLLTKYFENPQLQLSEYANLLYTYSGKCVSTSTLCLWFKHSLPFKSSMRKTSLFPHRKYTTENIYRLISYTRFIAGIDPMRIVYTDEKPIRGSDAYNRQVRRCPVTGTTPFLQTKFKLRNRYNLMTAIRIYDPFDKCMFHRMGTFSGNSVTFLSFVLEMVKANYLRHGDILVLDNCRIHNTDYCEFLSHMLLQECNIFVVFLPAYAPELNPIELCFNYFSQQLKHTNLRNVTNHSDRMFMTLCSVILDRINKNNVVKMYRKAGIRC